MCAFLHEGVVCLSACVCVHVEPEVNVQCLSPLPIVVRQDPSLDPELDSLARLADG